MNVPVTAFSILDRIGCKGKKKKKILFFFYRYLNKNRCVSVVIRGVIFDVWSYIYNKDILFVCFSGVAPLKCSTCPMSKVYDMLTTCLDHMPQGELVWVIDWWLIDQSINHSIDQSIDLFVDWVPSMLT